MSIQRAKNCTDREREEFVRIIQKYKDILEIKKTDVESMKKKHETWDKITSEFNSVADFKRKPIQLQLLYRNMKQRYWKRRSSVEPEQTSQSNTPTTTHYLLEEQFEFVPLKNGFDGSAEYYEEEEKSIKLKLLKLELQHKTEMSKLELLNAKKRNELVDLEIQLKRQELLSDLL